MKNTRNLGIDVLRVLSVFYIVGIWHMVSYSTVDWGLTSSFLGDRLTNIVLGTFVFISGYFLNTKYVEQTVQGLYQFYLKRLLRLYPLYMVALVAYYVFHINGVISSAKAFFLTSMLVRPAPATLWFVSMILLFTILAPFFMTIYRNTTKWQFWAFVIFLLGSLYGYHQLTSNLDVRMILYLPVFLVGLIVSENGLQRSYLVVAGWSFILGGLVTVYTRYVLALGAEDTFVTQIPFVLGGAVLLYYLFSNTTITNTKGAKIIAFLSYASYGTYLFHRVIFVTLEKIYLPSEPIIQLFYLSIVGFSLSVAVGYTIQATYDQIILKVQKLAG